MSQAASGAHLPHSHGSLAKLTLGAIGVVYGDIGTSPLYAMRESLHAASRDGLVREDVLGVISLLVWTLMLIVTLKYVTLIMRADNNGEGGTLSLIALVQRALKRRPTALIALGAVGISLFFGDAIITPAMSVLSAVEGSALVAPGLQPYVVPMVLGIIVALFAVQSRGTEAVSVMFGPIMVVWFVVMAVMGIVHIFDDPTIFAALNPMHALGFLVENGLASFIVLGSVFLAVTGGEALYTDMGHFGRRPIRLAWGILVFPALTLSYLGQGAMVLARPETAHNPFFLMAPDWALPWLVLLATAATVIASQAVISGAFSVAKQAVQMGLLPRMEIRHTSETQYGQIYMPKINTILAMGVVALVLAFGSSSNLASAYGIAVTGDMVITSILAVFLLNRAWKWPLALTLAVMVPLLVLEGLFLAANLTKVADGGYIPILFAALLCLVMWTWVRGSAHVKRKSRDSSIDFDSLIRMLEKSHPVEVPGTAVFLTAEPDTAPPALLHNLKHNRVLHKLNFIVTVTVAPVPEVPEAERLELVRVNDRFVKASLTFGYMDDQNVPKGLALARKQGEKFDIMTTSFFLNHRSYRSARDEGLPVWQERLFISLARGATNATEFYRLPSNRVLELGQQLTI
ncbi:MAG: potassium transporter Kup [Gemmobacter sp.]|uniref:potassium transporter Kup n=1 Tax=Gemmobacter sp. TaxID=1898957 RepID=UPI001A3AFBD1|nr:potassium transporter Kup [Gemmobacter sp.]MBL8562641.1 potassium transporter Kup [Gemmobacter sp.]